MRRATGRERGSGRTVRHFARVDLGSVWNAREWRSSGRRGRSAARSPRPQDSEVPPCRPPRTHTVDPVIAGDADPAPGREPARWSPCGAPSRRASRGRSPSASGPSPRRTGDRAKCWPIAPRCCRTGSARSSGSWPGPEPAPYGRIQTDELRTAMIERDRSLPIRELLARIEDGAARYGRRLPELTAADDRPARPPPDPRRADDRAGPRADRRRPHGGPSRPAPGGPRRAPLRRRRARPDRLWRAAADGLGPSTGSDSQGRRRGLAKL